MVQSPVKASKNTFFVKQTFGEAAVFNTRRQILSMDLKDYVSK